MRYQECDAQQVVFNARYGDYIDLACFEFLRAALPRPEHVLDGTFEIQTVRQVTEWKASARFDDVLEVSMWTSRIGTTSFTLSAEIRRAGAADLIATIETIYVHVDHATFTKREIEPGCAPPSKPAPPASRSITPAICGDCHPEFAQRISGTQVGAQQMLAPDICLRQIPG